MRWATISARLLNGPLAKCVRCFASDTLLWLLYLVRYRTICKVQSTKKDHSMSPDTSNLLYRTPHRLVITVCLAVTFFGCMRTAEKFCGVTDHSENWQANLQKTQDGHCHVMGVAVRAGDSWIKAINTDFEITIDRIKFC